MCSLLEPATALIALSAPNAVGHDQAGDAVDAGIAVRGVRGVQLVAGADPGQHVAVLELLHELEVEVPRHAEQLVDARLPQLAQQEVADGARGQAWCSFRIRAQCAGLSA
jgi:hypothetical protein